jgi:NADPH:quinone reductase
MRAVISAHSSSGRRWQVAEVDEPELGSRDVLVRVAAAALNHADGLMRSDSYVPSDASWRVPSDRVGFELTGTVAAVGPTVTGVAVGDQVMAQVGADLVVNPEAEPIAEVLTVPGGPRCSIVLDHVGGGLLSDVLRAVPAGARIVQIGRLGGRSAWLDLELLAARRLILRGTTFRHRDLPELHDVTAQLRDEPKLATAWGGVVPTIDSVFALDAAEAAAARLISGQHMGKIVLLT